jgi:U4/U6 small nuclear ribonucleoprotein PRP3
MAPDLPNLVVVEGGRRTIKKYKGLMLRRIQWDNSKPLPKKTEEIEEEEDKKDQGSEDEHDDDQEEDEETTSLCRRCFLVWEGDTNKPVFDKFRHI